MEEIVSAEVLERYRSKRMLGISDERFMYAVYLDQEVPRRRAYELAYGVDGTKARVNNEAVCTDVQRQRELFYAHPDAIPREVMCETELKARLTTLVRGGLGAKPKDMIAAARLLMVLEGWGKVKGVVVDEEPEYARGVIACVD